MARWRRRRAEDPLRSAADAAEALFHAGRYDQAATAFAACIRDHQAALPERQDDVEFNGRIAGLLNNLGMTLGKLRRYDEAVEILAGAVAVFDGLVRLDDADRWRPFMAGTLQSMAGALGDSGQLDRALVISAEAVELRRQGPRDNDLARALRMFAHVRAAANAELDEAQAAMNDAIAIHIAVISARPDDAYVNEIYTSYRVQEQVLRRAGRTEEADRVAELARSRHLDGLPAMLRAQQGGPVR